MRTLSVSGSCSLTYSNMMGVTIWYTVGNWEFALENPVVQQQ